MTISKRLILLGIIFLLVAGTACEPVATLPTPTATSVYHAPTEQTVFHPSPIPSTPLPTPTSTAEPLTLWIDPSLPAPVLDNLPAASDLPTVSSSEEADLRLAFNGEQSLLNWTFALVAPFATVADGVSAMEFENFWRKNANFPADALVMGELAYAALASVYGEPGPQVLRLPEAELLEYCHNNVGVWAVIPFEAIVPGWKVLSIGEQNPLHKDFNSADYSLGVPIGINLAKGIEKERVQPLVDRLIPLMPAGNRDPNLLTTVMLTGVTALVRATAKEMELKGVTRPGEVIGDAMREADIAHISNEVPFDANCPPPQWVMEEDLVFCSDDRYIELLREIGTDVVELTGDHFQDWGSESMLHTLDIYDSEGWPYYGGGRDIAEAKAPVKFEHNGNKIAFLGCNSKAPGYATASETNPGAFHCDMDYMAETVENLVAEGYLPIVTFQHVEIYKWEPTEAMVDDFHRMAEAGAIIISGSQAHQPHTVEFYEGAFLHYGLGNLFFDQLGWWPDTDKAFLDRHVFYDGRYLGVELLTVQFFDWSQPVWMTTEARQSILETLFVTSGLR